MFTKTVPLAAGHPLIGVVAPDYAYLDETVSRMMRQSPTERPQSISKIKEETGGQR
jgi:hypothetical protein